MAVSANGSVKEKEFSFHIPVIFFSVPPHSKKWLCLGKGKPLLKSWLCEKLNAFNSHLNSAGVGSSQHLASAESGLNYFRAAFLEPS